MQIEKSSRIVFMGTPEFSVPSLKALIDNGYNVVGVFTQPDRPSGRGKKLLQSPVKVLALEHGIPVFQPLKIRADGLEDLKGLKPDICITAAFGQILSQEVLDVPRYTINVHASILPRHRGAAPIQWAIMSGDKETGVTTMITDKGIDTGDMLLFKYCDIRESDTGETLSNRLSTLGAELLIETLEKFDSISPQKQDESKSTYDPMLKKEIGEIDFNRPALEIFNKIRALQPWPKAYFMSESGQMYKILASRVSDTKSTLAPGTVVYADSKRGIAIATSDFDLIIEELQAPNKKAMDSKSYLLGNSVNERELAYRAFK